MQLSDKGKKLEQDLENFTGSEHLFYHRLFRNFYYTEGVQFLAQEAGAYWLIDLIAGYQKDKRLQENWEELQYFQLWKLTVNENATTTLVCEDGNNNVVLSQTLEFTDFPLPQIKLFCESHVLLLPSEH